MKTESLAFFRLGVSCEGMPTEATISAMYRLGAEKRYGDVTAWEKLKAMDRKRIRCALAGYPNALEILKEPYDG